MKKIIIILLLSSLSMAAQVKKFGFYTNEVSSDGEHSVGYTLQLWQYNGTIIGRVSYNEGAIGDQASGFITDVAYDPKSKSLSFKSRLGDSSLEFTGNVYKSEVLGAFRWNAVKATKRESLKSCCTDAEINRDYKSLEEWNEMWKQFEH